MTALSLVDWECKEPTLGFSNHVSYFLHANMKLVRDGKSDLFCCYESDEEKSFTGFTKTSFVTDATAK